MKKRSLIIGLAIFVGMALIFNGCEQEAETETQTVTNGLAVDIKSLEELLATDGVSTINYSGTLDIGDKTLVIPAGKTVNVKSGGVKIKDGTLGLVGTLTLPSGVGITVSGSGHVFSNVAVPGVKAEKIYTGISDVAAASETEVALLDVSAADLTADNVAATKTLHILGNLTVAANASKPAAAGSVKVEGKLILAGDADVSDWTQFDISQATLKNSAAATVTLPSTATLKAIDATAAKLTIPGGSAGITLSVGGIAGEVALTGKVTVNEDGLNVKEGAELSVSDSAELTISADTSIAGKLTVASGGKIVAPALDPNTGLQVDKELTLAGAGTIELAQGAIGYYGTTAFIGPAPESGANSYLYNWDSSSTGGKVTLKDNYVTELTSGSITAANNTGIAASTTVVITEDAELTVASGVTLTVGGTLTVAGTVDVTAGTLTKGPTGTIIATGEGQIIGVKTYPLTDNDGDTPVSGTTTYLDGTAVQTVDSDGKPVFTITVTSKTGTKVPAPTTNVWGNAGDGKPSTSKFSDLALDMNAAITDTNKTYAVKTTTLGLLYYAGDTYLNTTPNTDGNQYFVTNTEITAPQPEDKPDVYISEDKSVAFKWKKYNSSTTLITKKNHGVLIWSEASPKTVTLEIDEVGTDDALTRVATIVINYDGVTFAD